jgi:hypothetical protein
MIVKLLIEYLRMSKSSHGLNIRTNIGALSSSLVGYSAVNSLNELCWRIWLANFAGVEFADINSLGQVCWSVNLVRTKLAGTKFCD